MKRIAALGIMIIGISSFLGVNAQVGVLYTNYETSNYVSSMKDDDFTYLLWDRNDDADGHFIDVTRPNFFYSDNDDSELHFLIDTGNLEKLNAYFSSLEVNGTIRSKEVLVEATGWPDFVFQKEYELPSLLQLEAYINQHGHLPDIPSSETVEIEGQNVGEMQKLLLQKIEELTLYTIEQEKIIQSHESKNEQLQGVIEHLIQRIETLENRN